MKASVSKGSVCKWEDSPDHGCGVCGTSLNSAKAKRNCYGTHSEPCIRYHQTMFQIGNSHKCEFCGRSNVQHEKRHKEIAIIIQSIKEYDEQVKRGEDPEGNSILVASSRGKPGSKSRIAVASRKRGKPLLRQIQELAIDDNMGQDAPTGDEAVAMPARRVLQDSNQNSTNRSTNSNTRTSIALEKDLRRLANAIHGPSRGDPPVKPDKANKMNVASIKRFQNLEDQFNQLSERRKKGSAVKSKNSSDGAIKLNTPLIQGILNELEIAVTPQVGKKRNEMLIKAAEAIYADIELVANEARETMKRCAAYWQFVSKRTYNNMIQNNQLVNWETGEKLSSIEEED